MNKIKQIFCVAMLIALMGAFTETIMSQTREESSTPHSESQTIGEAVFSVDQTFLDDAAKAADLAVIRLKIIQGMERENVLRDKNDFLQEKLNLATNIIADKANQELALWQKLAADREKEIERLRKQRGGPVCRILKVCL